MRNWRIITTLCFVVFCFVSSVNAQDAFKGTTISTIPNADVYPVPKGKYYPSSSRGVYDYVNNERVKRISKPQEMEVVCYTNCSPSVVYDTYVAILKGKQYYVPISSVEDNHLIEDVNGILSATYEEKLNAVRDNEQLHRAAYEMILAGIEHQIELNNQRIADIDHNADSLEFSFIKEEVAKDIQEKKIKRDKYYSWVKTLPSSVQPAAERIAITSSYFDGGYAGAFDYCMSFVNWSNKTIKYLYWTGKIKNAVGDFISCEARKQSTFSGRFAGPAASFSREFASWDHVIFNGEADEMVLTSLKIIYTDGSSYSINQSALKYITDIPANVIDKWDLVFDSSYEGLSDEELRAPWVLELRRADFRKTLAEKKKDYWFKNSHWRHLKERVPEWGLWNVEVSNLGWGDTHQKENEPILPELKLYESTRSARKGLVEDLERFKRANLLFD